MFLQPARFTPLRHARFSSEFVSRDEDPIKALYQSNGFRDVNVTDTVTTDYKGKKGDVSVTLHIDEGPQYTVSNLEVNGFTVPHHERSSRRWPPSTARDRKSVVWGK